MRYRDTTLQVLERIRQASIFEPDDIVLINVNTSSSSRSRWGKVIRVTSSGYVYVQLYSDRLGRYIHGGATYHPNFVTKLGKYKKVKAKEYLPKADGVELCSITITFAR